MMIFTFVSCMNVAQKLELTPCGDFLCNSGVQPIHKTGILMVAYSLDASVLARIQHLTIQRAKEHTKTKSNIPMAIATQNATSKMFHLFDYIIRIDDAFVYDAVIRDKNNPSYKPQWKTRLVYYASSPFETTLAIDSDVSIVRDVGPLFSYFDGYDIVVPNQERDSKSENSRAAWFPHNCVLMFKRNPQLFSYWWAAQLQSKVEDDQYTLREAIWKMKALRLGTFQSMAVLSPIHREWTSTRKIDITPIIPANVTPILIHYPFIVKLILRTTLAVPRAILIKHPDTISSVFNNSQCVQMISETCFAHMDYPHWSFETPPPPDIFIRTTKNTIDDTTMQNLQ